MSKYVVMNVDMSFLVAVEPDVSPQELEETIETVIQNLPGIKSYSCPHMTCGQIGAMAFCCPVCGGAIRQEVRVSGTIGGEINMASGVLEDSSFQGDQVVTYTCSEDPGHEIPSELQELLRNAVEMSPAESL